MLIRSAEIGVLEGSPQRVDLRISEGLIESIAESIAPLPGEATVDARGAALLPGLHDHHLHIRALAAKAASVDCGPPAIKTGKEMIQALLRASEHLPSGVWLRGVGYHERVAGAIDRDWLDRNGPKQPLRIQHRGGRCWIFNTLALHALGVDPDRVGDDPLERSGARASGRLFDADDWLRRRLPQRSRSLREVSQRLARYGVTAITDATPRNDIDEVDALSRAQACGELSQDVTVMGSEALDELPVLARTTPGGLRLWRGATKFHLHDAHLVDFDGVVGRVRRSHHADRAVAFHCVTRAELTFALAAIEEAGAMAGDRIEHASVTPPELMDRIVQLGLRVVVQPNFVGERGDAYLDEVDAEDQPWLYRLASFLTRGVMLAGSTDAPFGNPDPWASMRSAVQRIASDGRHVGPQESLSPEAAMRLFLPNLVSTIAVGMSADLCLLDRGWQAARLRLLSSDVRLTLKSGRSICNVLEP